MEHLKSGCSVPSVIFELRLIATKSEKLQFDLVFMLMKGKRNVFCIEN